MESENRISNPIHANYRSVGEKRKQCPDCLSYVKPESSNCPFCGTIFEEVDDASLRFPSDIKAITSDLTVSNFERVTASIFDIAIVFGIFLPVTFCVQSEQGNLILRDFYDMFHGVMFILPVSTEFTILITLLVVFEVIFNQKMPGKTLFRLQIVNKKDLEPVSIWKLPFRAIFKWGWPIPLLSLLTIPLTRERLPFHDFFLGTRTLLHPSTQEDGELT
jgi:uncharacterized RDD family membrane protein YckC